MRINSHSDEGLEWTKMTFNSQMSRRATQGGPSFVFTNSSVRRHTVNEIVIYKSFPFGIQASFLSLSL